MVSKNILYAIAIVAILVIAAGMFMMQPPSEQIIESTTTITRTFTTTVTEAPSVPEKSGAYELVGTSNAIRLSDPASLEYLGVGACVGPEDAAVDAQGRIYGGGIEATDAFDTGRIMRFQPDGSQPEVFAETGGRPLGLHFDAAGNLIVADSYKGLLSVAPDGSVTLLSIEADGVPFNLTDDVDIAEDGLMYFSDATYKYNLKDLLLDFYEGVPHGRLLVYDPTTKSTTALLEDLFFANGVAVSPDQSFVLVTETGNLRVTRYWLTGPKQGQSDIFIDGLLGWPDGISSNGKDGFWLALFSEEHGFILGLDMEGNVVHNIRLEVSPIPGSYAPITSVEEHDGQLYLGSTMMESIGRMPVPPKDLRQ